MKPQHAPHDTEVTPCLITLREAAALLRLSPRTLASPASRQRVSSYRFAGVDRLLFKPDELLALLQPTTTTRRSRRGRGLRPRHAMIPEFERANQKESI